MRKGAFLQTQGVAGFVEWLSTKLPQITVNLDIKPSPKVPGGIKETVVGLEAALRVYKWRASWTNQARKPVESMDWRTTSKSLHELGAWLRASVNSNKKDTLDACKQVLRWGGNRNDTRGALPFLEQQSDLNAYLRQCAGALSLTRADLDNKKPNSALNVVGEMNSMLTKVHALVADDGLPIYDSRVAATVSTLVEMWRRESNLSSIPAELMFPCLSVARSPLSYSDDAPNPVILSYDKKRIKGRTQDWVSAKVRLGWLMDALLQLRQDLFRDEGDLARRMHALEAALFMLGYDVSCLAKGQMKNTAHDKIVAARIDQGSSSLSLGAPKICYTLKQKKPVTYFGSLSEGILITYPSGQKLTIEPDQLEEIVQQLEEWGSVKCGASQSSVQDGTFAAWLVESGRQLFKRSISGQHVSHIAAVLVEESEGRIVSYQRDGATWISCDGA